MDTFKLKENQAILSKKSINEWRGSITIFNGFNHTKSNEELCEKPFHTLRDRICQAQPQVTADKTQGHYFVACLLKDAPLVRKTLKNAQQDAIEGSCHGSIASRSRY